MPDRLSREGTFQGIYLQLVHVELKSLQVQHVTMKLRNVWTMQNTFRVIKKMLLAAMQNTFRDITKMFLAANRPDQAFA